MGFFHHQTRQHQSPVQLSHLIRLEKRRFLREAEARVKVDVVRWKGMCVVDRKQDGLLYKGLVEMKFDRGLDMPQTRRFPLCLQR